MLAWRDGYYHEVEDARGMIRPVRSFPLSPNRPAMRSRGFVFISRRTRAVGGGGEWLEHLLEDITLLMHSSASSVSRSSRSRANPDPATRQGARRANRSINQGEV